VDAIVNGMLKGGAPRFATEWAGKLGAAAPQMSLSYEWGRSLQPNLAALRKFGQSALADTDAYLDQLKDADLDRMVDLSNVGLGTRCMGWVFNALVASHLSNMAGEISARKGVQGKKGYPV
jgi:hypothetical protein